MDEFAKMEAQYEVKVPKVDESRKKVEELSEARKEVESLTERERTAVEEFSKKINIVDSNQVLNYGQSAQRNMDGFTQTVLSSVKTKDAGETGDLITSVVMQLNGCQVDSNAKGIKKLFSKGKNYTATMKAKYDSVEENVDKVKEELEQHVITLEKDLAIYENMFEQNKKYYKELNYYIIAGKLAVESAKEEAKKLYKEAQETGSQEKAQEYNDLMAAIDRFERKLMDLATTKAISLQMIPQIRMLQNADYALIDKINSTINNTIPVWKSQLIILLGEENAKDAVKVQEVVDNITDEMLKKNAETLHMVSVETAKALERPTVSVETLRKSQELLIATLDEVSKIKQEAREKRAITEKELEKLEADLKQKLLSTLTDSPRVETTVGNDKVSVVSGDEIKLTL